MTARAGFLLALAAWAGPAAAQSDLPVAAQAEFDRGREAYRTGQYAQAAEAFRAAYAIEPAPGLLMNAALAFERLGDLRAVREYLERFLQVATDARYVGARSRAQAMLDDVRQRLPTKVQFISEPEGASIYVDSVRFGALGKTPFATELASGPHAIILEKDGYATEQRTVHVLSGEDMVVEVRLNEAQGRLKLHVPTDAELRIDGVPAQLAADKILVVRVGMRRVVVVGPNYVPLVRDVRVREQLERELIVRLGSTRSYRPYVVGLAGAALALLPVGGYFAWDAHRRADQVQAAFADGRQDVWDKRLREIEAAGQRDAWLGVASFSLAAAAAAAAAVLYLVEPSHVSTLEEVVASPPLEELAPSDWQTGEPQPETE